MHFTTRKTTHQVKIINSLTTYLAHLYFLLPNNASSSSSSTHKNNNDQQNNNSNNYSNILKSIENNSIDFGNPMLSAGNEDEFSFNRLNPHF